MIEGGFIALKLPVSVVADVAAKRHYIELGKACPELVEGNEYFDRLGTSLLLPIRLFLNSL